MSVFTVCFVIIDSGPFCNLSIHNAIDMAIHNLRPITRSQGLYEAFTTHIKHFYIRPPELHSAWKVLTETKKNKTILCILILLQRAGCFLESACSHKQVYSNIQRVTRSNPHNNRVSAAVHSYLLEILQTCLSSSEQSGSCRKGSKNKKSCMKRRRAQSDRKQQPSSTQPVLPSLFSGLCSFNKLMVIQCNKCLAAIIKSRRGGRSF